LKDEYQIFQYMMSISPRLEYPKFTKALLNIAIILCDKTNSDSCCIPSLKRSLVWPRTEPQEAHNSVLSDLGTTDLLVLFSLLQMLGQVILLKIIILQQKQPNRSNRVLWCLLV